MATEYKASFDFDTGQIFSKLHLAGLQPLKNKNVINTGILNNDPSAKPDKPKDVNFDFKSKDGKYEVGIFTLMEYQAPLTEKNDKALIELNKNKSNLNATDPKAKDIETKIAERKEELVELNKKRQEDYNKELSKIKKDSLSELKKYFTVFSGKEMAARITENNIKQVVLSDTVKDSKDKNVVKDYKIQQITKEELEKKQKEIAEDQDKADKAVMNVCFKIGYTILMS